MTQIPDIRQLHSQRLHSQRLQDEQPTQETRVRGIRMTTRARTLNLRKAEALSKVVGQVGPGETMALVSHGSIETLDFLQWMVSTVKRIDELYIATWTLNTTAIEYMAELAERVMSGNIVVGRYYANRKPVMARMLYGTIERAGWRYCETGNHAKVTLLKAGSTHYVLECSANYCVNRLIEQYTVHNDEPLYRFHQGWMDEELAGAKSLDRYREQIAHLTEDSAALHI